MADKSKPANAADCDCGSACNRCRSKASESKAAPQDCSAEPSEVACSSGQETSDCVSEKGTCLKCVDCPRRREIEKENCGESSGESSPSCPASSGCEFSESCLESKVSAKRSKAASTPDSEQMAGNLTSTNSSADASVSKGSSQNDASSEDASAKDGSTNSAKPCIKERSSPKDDQSGWSLSEDLLLRSMKKANDGLSWEDIGRSLKRSKNECKSRWKMIKERPAAEEKGDTDVSKDEKPVGNAPPSEPVSQNGNKTPASTASNQRCSADKASDTESAERERQKQYWREHIGRRLYPATIRVEADAHFSQSDCNALEMVDARYQSLRWLEMQARFYNETGRIAPLEVIRSKCEHGSTARTRAEIVDWIRGVDTR